MVGLYVTVPVACFRMAHAREFWETHPVPPPSTCYGFLLSLVGEQDRKRHVGCRVTSGVFGEPSVSVVLRTLWRIKTAKLPPGVGNNKTPGHQQLLTNVELVIWLDSTEERGEAPTLETRVEGALAPDRRGRNDRFGGLSLGESTHMVNEVRLLTEEVMSALRGSSPDGAGTVRMYRERGQGLTLPVWVDHVGSKGTRYVVGQLEDSHLELPALGEIPMIRPPD